jgi:hypothetical protein
LTTQSLYDIIYIEIKKGGHNMANVCFNNKFEICAMVDSPEYLYIDDVDAFIQECGDTWIFENVDKTGVYHWNDYQEVWEPAISLVEEKIKEVMGATGGITKVKENTFVGWNIVITLDSGDVIKTNSEPVDMNEVQEAINIMLKPSFFGKRIKKFEIVAE